MTSGVGCIYPRISSFYLISSSIIIIFSSLTARERPVSFEIFFKNFIISLKVIRSINRSQEIVFDTLFLYIIICMLVPYWNCITLKSCSYFDSTDVILSLKLISNDCKKQIFPKSVWISFLNPYIPSPTFFACLVFPKRFDSILEQMVWCFLL